MSDYVCEDLMVEIFSRLPPTSLLRFRSLSKSLCSFISSQYFIRMHTLRSKQKVLIRQRGYDKEDKSAEDFYTLHPEDRLPLCPISGFKGIKVVHFPLKYSEIVGSCNGIICLFGYRTGISLWNPSIRRKLALPYHPSWVDTFKTHRIAAGFGYDIITQEYKIVTISYPQSREGDAQISLLIYSLKTSVWGEIVSPTPLFTYVMSRACFVNGALHWVVKNYLHELDIIGHCYILTFNLNTSVFGKIELPEPSWETRHLTIIKGSLAVVSTQRDISSTWVLSEYTNTTRWSAAFSLISGAHDEGVGKVLQLTNGEFLFNTFIYEDEGYYLWNRVYNRQTGVISDVKRFLESAYEEDIEMCVESLELLGNGTAWEEKQPSFLGGEKRNEPSQELEWLNISLL